MRSRIVRSVVGIIGGFLTLVGTLGTVWGLLIGYRAHIMLGERETGGAGEGATIVSAGLGIGLALSGVVCVMLGIGLLQLALRHKKKRSVKNTQ